MSLLNVEKKFFDKYDTININYTGTVVDLTSGITQGVGASQRTGDGIRITRIRLRYYVTANPITAFTLVLGHSKDGLPSAGDVFYLSGSAFPLGGMSFANPYNDRANEVRWERFGVASIPDDYHFEGSHEMKVGQEEGEITFSSASTTVLEGAWWIAAISNLNAGVPTLSYATRVEYVDN
jgi:hypothetical protein